MAHIRPIFTKDLGMRQVSAKVIPQLLTEKQKENWKVQNLMRHS
jgi:hypothetical protein